MAIGLLLLSTAGNFVAVGAAVVLLESEPFEPNRDELIVVELTEPEPEPEKPEPEQDEPEQPSR